MSPASAGPAGAPAGAPAAAVRYAIPFSELTLDMVSQVGGKNASLGELVRELAAEGVSVPDGFALPVAAYRRHVLLAGLGPDIQAALDELDVTNLGQLVRTGRSIREWILGAELPPEVGAALERAYSELSRRYAEEHTDVAVRSSATAEDLPEASFAGQQETFLNVRGPQQLDHAVRACMASLFTDRAIVYRAEHGISHRDVALSVGVQKMVRSDLGSAGVVFTLDTESGFRDVVLVTGSWGLGELVVQGRVNPDEFWVHKPTLALGHRPLLRKELGSKATRLVYAAGGSKAVIEERVPRELRERAVLDDDEVLRLARWAVAIERHYGRRYGRATPMDIEWAKDGRTGELFVVQARPETVHSQAASPRIELFKLRGQGTRLLTGRAVGGRVGAGPVRIVRGQDDMRAFRDGEVLVAPMTDPDWEPVLRRAAAVVTDQGGRTCHAAIVSREAGIPCVVGTTRASTTLRDGQLVTVSCAEGEQGAVYEGRLPFDREELDPARLPVPPVPLMLNVANPDTAFRLAQLPSAGVGLLRIEFLISHWIGVHPLALLQPEQVGDEGQRAAIAERVRGYREPAQFFVERLASGIGLIAAAFYPRPVIVRFSDFKTNEYAGLLGGRAFEPVEANPMIGFRGASRYYDERYREGFALECRAIRRVRDDMGLTNVKLMIPFCRTLKEGQAVLDEMAKHGLRRGERQLEVWVMCEIPNNVVLAAEFSRLFDGFSIGSNDLTQLTLGVDRDSALLAHVFDERDPGVKRLIAQVVAAAHAAGRRVGLCGQAPSDDPAFAEFLVATGIDSISLTPDSLPGVARRLAAGAQN
ncbi:MAG TPA: phosphoenolpyruvate synthase [Planctomycetota bacterium]|nr:phosphoenolpyruvate synthase [Planctomycetota bacterium]